jgi:hypothetical protein
MFGQRCLIFKKRNSKTKEGNFGFSGILSLFGKGCLDTFVKLFANKC